GGGAEQVEGAPEQRAPVEPVSGGPLPVAQHQHGEVPPGQERRGGERPDGPAEDDHVEGLGGQGPSRPKKVRSPFTRTTARWPGTAGGTTSTLPAAIQPSARTRSACS